MDLEIERWIKVKQQLSKRQPHFNFNELELWWCAIGLNVGDEEQGKGRDFARPVIIFKKFNKVLFWGIPTTLQIKNTTYTVSLNATNQVMRQAIVSQLKLYDIRRLLAKIGSISKEDAFYIRKAVVDISTTAFLSFPL